MIRYAIEAESAVEADVQAAFDWYEGEEPGLGFEFLAELRAAYELIIDHPVGYQDIRSGIRRALTRRFPYAVTSRSKEKLSLSSRFSALRATPPL